MKHCNRVVLTNNGSWHETYSTRSWDEAYDVRQTPISKFLLLAEEDGGEWLYLKHESDLQVPIYITYQRKLGKIVSRCNSVNYNRALLYWEEGERTGNFVYLSQGDTDYDVINITAYGKKARKLIHHVIEFLSPVLLGTLANQYAQKLIPKGDDADESAESEMGMC